MKYDLMKVLRALEALYTCDFNPLDKDWFTRLFCERYQLDVEVEHRRIDGMLRVLHRQNKIRIDEEGMIHMENMLTSNLKLEIKG